MSSGIPVGGKHKTITVTLNEEMYGKLLRMARATSCGAYEMPNGEISHALPAISAEQFAAELIETLIVSTFNERFPREVEHDYVVQ